MKEFKLILNKLKEKAPLLDEDYSLLLHYLQKEENETKFKQALSSHWDEVCEDDNLELSEPDDLFYKIYYKAQEQDKLSKPKVLRIGLWIQRIASAVVIPLLLTFAWYYYNSDKAVAVADDIVIESPVNTKTRFFLPDGTNGWLQANSFIRFAYGDKNQREVTLNGEAFFDVSKNENQPFIVNTSAFKVKVLGTRFNVLSDSNSSVSKVYLEEGSIEMLGINNEHHTILKPGEEYLFDKLKCSYTVNNDVADDHLAWTKGVLLLKNKTLKEAAIELEKFYNIEIDLVDKELEDMLMYAKVQHERLEDVLELTKLVLPINYKIEGPLKLRDGTFTKRKVVIKKNN